MAGEYFVQEQQKVQTNIFSGTKSAYQDKQAHCLPASPTSCPLKNLLRVFLVRLYIFSVYLYIFIIFLVRISILCMGCIFCFFLYFPFETTVLDYFTAM